ncbi:MAG TPA: UbiA family prenyltransferase [Chitinophagaceae bacterium]|nr:UbiA family prenyltransferase [Chitinophagaceae bacterium]
MLHRSTLQLLRFHFSFFLLPVFLFALALVPSVDPGRAWLAFILLHLLVYPASNGYNSYMDRDETPIGGLRHPMQPTRQLFYVTIVLDVLATGLSFLISPFFALGILFYIMASRAYSYRRIRLKRYPVTGFLTVFIFQGALVFFLSYHAADAGHTLQVPLLPCFIASLLIGASYPLTQIYQHEADRADGVITLSCLLGKRGTFLFSGLLFGGATAALFFWWAPDRQPFLLFLVITAPVVLFFLYWMQAVWRNEAAADFRHSLLMNAISTLCMTAYFSTLILSN